MLPNLAFALEIIPRRVCYCTCSLISASRSYLIGILHLAERLTDDVRILNFSKLGERLNAIHNNVKRELHKTFCIFCSLQSSEVRKV
jgi:hypothetical protein